MGEFSEKVFEAVRRVPRGKVATYGQIARMIGSPRSARYVGYALRSNPEPWANGKGVPCHRVIFKDGSLCGTYAFGGADAQRALLEAEGVAFADEAHVDMGACLWDGRTQEADRTGGRTVPAGAPTAPPADFDWKRELGEEG
ncbi:cysteine methyltransferase [Gordonibacter sp. An230]|uniref:MGMT family protein n=1 Tax=Gordonibacter sp. An230 TaxID=1965592 RepID=UPI000B38DD2E|nr:MGMT family protein [Gordonibacter sp. An230]OUO89670.1 cysteine methyltransferase [Gordonibacter sp. An230]